jgi:hypothetical protein
LLFSAERATFLARTMRSYVLRLHSSCNGFHALASAGKYQPFQVPLRGLAPIRVRQVHIVPERKWAAFEGKKYSKPGTGKRWVSLRLAVECSFNLG